MKSFITACFLLTIFSGTLINSQVTPLFSEKDAEGIRLFTPTQYFGAQLVICILAGIAFYFIAIPFNRRLAEEQKTAS